MLVSRTRSLIKEVLWEFYCDTLRKIYGETRTYFEALSKSDRGLIQPSCDLHLNEIRTLSKAHLSEFYEQSSVKICLY